MDIIKPWLWKKGQSGNLKGRPKGKTMKDYARDYLSKMTDDERDDFMEGLPKDIIWKMAEGNPHQSSDETVEVIIPKPVYDGISRHNSYKEDIQPEEKD